MKLIKTLLSTSLIGNNMTCTIVKETEKKVLEESFLGAPQLHISYSTTFSALQPCQLASQNS